MQINRRGILLGLASVLAAPAIVHAGNLMPIKALKPEGFSVLLTGFDQFGVVRQETIMIRPPLSPADMISQLSEFDYKSIKSITNIRPPSDFKF